MDFLYWEIFSCEIRQSDKTALILFHSCWRLLLPHTAEGNKCGLLREWTQNGTLCYYGTESSWSNGGQCGMLRLNWRASDERPLSDTVCNHTAIISVWMWGSLGGCIWDVTPYSLVYAYRRDGGTNVYICTVDELSQAWIRKASRLLCLV